MFLYGVQILAALVVVPTALSTANVHIPCKKNCESLNRMRQNIITRGLLGEFAPANASKRQKSKSRFKRPPQPHATLHRADKYTARSEVKKQDNTKEYQDYSQYQSLPSAYLKRPFNLTTLVSMRTPNRCANVLWKFHAGEITNLAVARTGSETVTQSLLVSGLPAHHNHDCTLAAMSNRGATRLLVTLRHPVARIISGYQRRMDQNVSKNKDKQANVEFAKVFSRGVDDYVSALRLPQHRYHKEALECTYGPNRQSFMLPLVGWYFGDTESESDHDEYSSEVQIRFLCTNKLSVDFMAAASAFGFALSPLQFSHRSNISSDGGVEIMPNLQLSRPNIEWLEEVYKKDIAFVTKRCGKKARKDSFGATRAPAAPASSFTAVFTCPRGDMPGTCIENVRVPTFRS